MESMILHDHKVRFLINYALLSTNPSFSKKKTVKIVIEAFGFYLMN